MIEQCEKCKHKEILNGGIVGCLYMGADCRKGEMFDPITNADRIRAMSDKELAKQLVFMSTICEFCVKRKNCEDVPGYEYCMDGILDWLQQPAEGE